MNGQEQPNHFDAHKNELCEQEQYILNMIKFELDTHPVFYDIIEVFMAQGILYTSDCIDRNGMQ